MSYTKQDQTKHIRKPRQKTCKVCKKKFTPDRPMQTTCSPLCAIKYGREQDQKAKRKKSASQKKDMNWNDRTWLKAEAQRRANEWGRLSDRLKHGVRCITCGTTSGKMDGGHAYPTQSYSAYRYNVKQIHQQCYQCNQIHSGRYHEYRQIIRQMYGNHFADMIEASNQLPARYSTEWYQRFIKVARKRISVIKKRIQVKENYSF